MEFEDQTFNAYSFDSFLGIYEQSNFLAGYPG